uniref:Uncharacterized protein n=1 Tax=Arundo donax TaxID=35708 RepID=A0A0A9ADK3_ARUDO
MIGKNYSILHQLNS